MKMSTYTLVVKDCDVIDKHMDCEMKCRGSCTSGGRGNENECATPVTRGVRWRKS